MSMEQDYASELCPVTGLLFIPHVYTRVPHNTVGYVHLKSGCIVKSYHGLCFSIDLHVMT
jgi:hypothetical protein